MKKNIGIIRVKNNHYSFIVKWDEDNQTSWVEREIRGIKDNKWEQQVGIKVSNEKDALSVAQKYIDLQYGDINTNNLK